MSFIRIFYPLVIEVSVLKSWRDRVIRAVLSEFQARFYEKKTKARLFFLFYKTLFKRLTGTAFDLQERSRACVSASKK